MAEFSKEGAELKRKFLKMFYEWEKEFYDGGQIRKTPSNPTGKGITKGRAYRGLASFLLSDDKVHMDYVSNRLAKGGSIKSIMGGLGGRVQKRTDGGLSPFAVTPTDQMHHQNPNAAYFEAARENDVDVLTDFLQRSADQGVYYGETDENLKGTSLDARPHTGSRGKGGSKHNPTVAGAGGPGATHLSAHPRNTQDLEGRLPVIKYASGQEMFDAGQFIRDLHSDDIILGQTIDAPRRAKANEILQQNQILPAEVDAFGSGTSEADIAKANKFFQKNPDALTEVAESFQLPTDQAKLEADLRANGFKGVIPEINVKALRGIGQALGKLPGPAKAAGAVITTAMTLSDVAQASEGAQKTIKAESPRERVKGALQATSGALGVASAVAPNPLTVGGSAITGFLGGVMDHFDQKRGRQQRDSALQTGVETSTAAEVPAQITQYNRTPNRYERRNR